MTRSKKIEPAYCQYRAMDRKDIQVGTIFIDTEQNTIWLISHLDTGVNQVEFMKVPIKLTRITDVNLILWNDLVRGAVRIQDRLSESYDWFRDRVVSQEHRFPQPNREPTIFKIYAEGSDHLPLEDVKKTRSRIKDILI